ncbi:MAG: extracellular solute-binding protein [Ruminiclostridium sp.]|nr:extracellular solute-binding protein [Ruminiclostridium sp.]
MKGRKWVKGLSIVFTFLLLFSVISGCGNTAADKTAETTTATTEGATTAVEQKDLPVIDVTIMHQSTNLEDQEGIKNDRIIKYVEDKFKIKLHILSADGDFQKMQLNLASGQPADIITVNASSADERAFIKKQAEDGVILNIGDVVRADPDKYKALNKIFGEKEYQFFNKSIFGAPDKNFAYLIADATKNHYGGVAYNMKYLASKNLQIPSTIDELITLLREIKKDKNVIPYNIITNKGNMWWEVEKVFFNPYGAYIDKIQMDENGKWYDPAINPQNKELWKKLQGYYKEGLIDKETLTKEMWAYESDFAQGKLITFTGYLPQVSFYPWYLKDFLAAKTGDSYKDLVVQPHPLKGPDGKTAVTNDVPFTVNMANIIPKATKNPERIVELLNYIVSDEGTTLEYYGLEGVHYTVDGSGNKVKNMDEWLKDSMHFSSKWYHGLFMDMTSGGINYYQFEKYGWYQGILNNGQSGFVENMHLLYTDVTPEVLQYVKDLDKVWIDETFKEMPIYTRVTYSDAERKISKTLEEIRNRYYSGFFTGTLDVDKEWDKFVQEYTNAGSDIIVKAQQRLSDENKKEYDEFMK